MSNMSFQLVKGPILHCETIRTNLASFDRNNLSKTFEDEDDKIIILSMNHLCAIVLLARTHVLKFLCNVALLVVINVIKINLITLNFKDSYEIK